ncbi:VanW family protein, partial [Actinomadura miaoliensis]|uniref:VanW family protein n=1 Tax=Actinomadura miaoliensis TaxID=430685 RepID=UPI0031EB4439
GWPFVAVAFGAVAAVPGTYLAADIGTRAGDRASAAENASAFHRAAAAGRAPGPAPAPVRAPAPVQTPAPPPGAPGMISSYTTRFTPGEPRVRNIQLAARILDGVVVRPGRTFSFNRAIGPRTRARGYVPAPSIKGSRMVADDVGGGICQVSSTLFNAVFEAGMRIRRTRSHSLWMPEYPIGREAAVAYPDLDFTWTNDSRHPVTIRTSYTGASLTVSLWGVRRYDVRSKTSPRYGFTPYGSAIGLGASCLPTRGARGFQVDVWRVLARDGRTVRRERFHTTYEPRTRVRCVGPRRGAGR